MSDPKCFVLDTNVLLHTANAIESFADNNVILPMAVIEELDTFKTRSDEVGRNARQVTRALDSLRSRGNLREGVPNDHGGLVRIVSSRLLHEETGLDVDNADNRIIKVAYALHKQGKTVIFISKDINARIKADALGLEAQDFEKQKVNFDEMYQGYREVLVPTQVVDDFYKLKSYVLENEVVLPNEFIILIDETNPKHTGIGKVQADGKLVHLNDTFAQAWHIKPKNREQRMAFELLLDEKIPLVTLMGKAGTGKTLFALAAALDQTLNRNKTYDKILVSRPIMPLGRDIGYLPGSKDNKLSSWMMPIFDNLEFLMRWHGMGFQDKAQKKVEDLMKENIIELEALTYIRGRTIARHFLIVDEAQNLTPHEIKTIVSRAGEGTKVVLTGDAYQIDNPYLDSSSNGLAYAAEHLKESPLHGHITLEDSERSPLAALAASSL